MKKIILTLIFLFPTIILANVSVAKITALKGSAQIEQGSQSRVAKLGADLFKNDKIITNSNAKVQVIFKDETIITIGKNSEFSVDEFISDGAASEVKLSLFKGAMRTITGKIGKANPSKFKVKTKTATIGIRGTNFVVVATPGSDMVACTLGAITVTGNSGTVEVSSGFMTQIAPSGDVSPAQEFSSGELGGILEGAFGGTEKETDTTEDSGEAEATDGEKEELTEESSNTETTETETTETEQEESADTETTESETVVTETTTEETDTLILDTTTVEETVTAVDTVVDTATDTIADTALTDTTTTVTTTTTEAVTYYYGFGGGQFLDDSDNADWVDTDADGIKDTDGTDAGVFISQTDEFHNAFADLTIGILSTGLSSDSKFAFPLYDDQTTPVLVTTWNVPITQVSYTDWDLFEADFVDDGTGVTAVMEPINNPLATETIRIDTTRPVDNYISAIADLDSNDDVAWGVWSMPVYAVEVFSDATPTNYLSDTLKGHFVFGKQSTDTLINSFANTSATYTGQLLGYSIESVKSTKTMVGTIPTTLTSTSLVSTVNFGADTISSVINFNVGAEAYTINTSTGTLSGAHFTDTIADTDVTKSFGTITDGKINGSFYGTDGKTMAGDFFIIHDDPNNDTLNQRMINGVFQAKTTDVLP